MGANALTLQIRTNKPGEAVRRIGVALSRLSRPAGIVGFASGPIVSSLTSLAETVKAQLPGLPALFAGSDGVFTEEGELPDQDGLVCLILSGTKFEVAFEEEARRAWLGKAQSDAASERPLRICPKMVLASSQVGLPNWCRTDIASEGSFWGWFGAVTSSDATMSGVDVDGRVLLGEIATVGFSGLEPPLVMASPCCRLISPPLPISSVEGNTVLELDGVPALVALGQASSKLVDRSWIVVAISHDPNCVPNTNDGAPNLLFRPVRGIDPGRGAIILTESVSTTTKLAFAVRDDRASRHSLEDALRMTKPRLRGASPRFGIYFDGLGRGRSLYGAPNVDLGLVRQALGAFPVLGMRSAFELRGDIAALGTQTLTGQLALFRNAS